MRRVFEVFTVCFLILTAFVSCERNNIEVNDLQTQAFITKSGQMGFSFYANGEFSATSGNKVIITSPDGNFTWTSPIVSVEHGSVKYYGSSDFMMPEGVELQKGTYQYTIVCKDGRTIEHSFGISFGDPDGALERCTGELPYYDRISNLTVVK